MCASDWAEGEQGQRVADMDLACPIGANPHASGGFPEAVEGPERRKLQRSRIADLRPFEALPQAGLLLHPFSIRMRRPQPRRQPARCQDRHSYLRTLVLA